MCEKYRKFVQEFEEKMTRLYTKENYSNLIFLCIGTNKVIGDSVGPIVGNELKSMENNFVQIYGTMDNTLNFINAREIIKELYYNFDNPFLVTIDAALSEIKKRGDIVVSDGYIKIGKALQKSICFYSNINIKCVVGKSYLEKEKNVKELKSVKIEETMEIANVVSSGIKNVLKKSNIYV